MKIKKFPLLIFCILICEAAGLIGGFFTFPSIAGWYVYLNKPFFSPPNWIFGPVWTTLYGLMGISLYLVLREGFGKKGVASFTKLFVVHLGVNSLWSIVFFGAKNILGAFVILVILWVMILILIMRSKKVNKTASYLLYPYIAWVSFAGVLNLSLLLLNR